MNDLTIAGTAIRRDSAGRYCLNDLHRVAGGNPNHRPGEWLRNKQAQELIAELGDAEIPASAPVVVSLRGGDGTQGTFVARELVFAYAMWIRPAFHLAVIRAYDAMNARQAVVMDLRDPKQLVEAARQLVEVSAELQAKVESMQPSVAAHHLLSKADGRFCVTDAAKALQMRPKDLFDWLRDHRWIYGREGGTGWRAYQDRIQQGVLVHKIFTATRANGSQKIVERVLVTSKGLARLAEQVSINPKQEALRTASLTRAAAS